MSVHYRWIVGFGPVRYRFETRMNLATDVSSPNQIGFNRRMVTVGYRTLPLSDARLRSKRLKK